MRHTKFTRALPVILCLAMTTSAPNAASAQEDKGRGLMERGAEMFLRGLKDEMAPALDGLRDLAEEMQPAMRSFVSEMGPAFADILKEIKDFSRYHPPEIQPNGDIIMRRKLPEAPAPKAPDAPQDTTPGKKIDL